MPFRQTSLRKRLSHDLAFNVNYTFGKNMSISQGDFWPGANLRVQDENNFVGDCGPNYLDRTHIFNFDLPILPFDRRLNARSVLRQAVGGWELNGVVSASTGSPLNVVQAPGSYEFARPDYTGADPYLHTDNRFQYLNPAAFVAVPPGSGGPVRPGNLGKNNLRNPGAWNVNLTVGKKIQNSGEVQPALSGRHV